MTLSDIGGPFILLDDARIEGAAAARLFRNPQHIEQIYDAADMPAFMQWIGKECANEALIAGFLSYEAGGALEPALDFPNPAAGAPPLAWFGRFTAMERIEARDVPALLPDPEAAWALTAEPHINRADYDTAIDKVLNLIRAGDIYQANLTFQASVRFAGHPLALYARLRQRQQAGYGGIIFTGKHWLLSFSPELFFSQRGVSIMARPMKGTALRDRDPVRDAANATALAHDDKQRAENLMIVDLIRNDLSRIAVAGSVTVPDLFHVEQYPTVHQMVSSVHATLAPDKRAVDIIAQAFPCGSITGAPKIRAMEVIAATETEPRGAYTGSIGYMSGTQEAAFNVAIRTLVIPHETAPSARWGHSRHALLGLGSGIVADSVAGAEWSECLAKGRFVESVDAFDLIETMGFDPEDGMVRLEAHLARMKSSAAELGFIFDRHGARNELQAATFRLREPAKIRMMLSRKGNLAIEVAPLPEPLAAPVAVALVPLPVATSDWRLRHKTTQRAFYDDARRHVVGAFEVIFATADGALTEGSFTSLFVERDGTLLTPPLNIGLLPGILRETLIADGKAMEAPLTVDDLKDGFFIGNSLRGLMPAYLADPLIMKLAFESS